jgi:Flp pilus assembly protein TadG
MIANIPAHMRAFVRRPSLRRNDSGSAAIEFAFLLPVALMFLGLVVIIGEALAVGQKVTLTARTIVDIVAKQDAYTSATLTSVLNAAAYTMAPYDTAKLTMVVSEIQTDANGNATVTWSYAGASGGTPLTKGSTFALPSTMATANTTYIYGVVNYSLMPPVVGFALSGPIQLSDVGYFSPRVSSGITVTN